ncbi:phosphotyrosine protein phosphatase [Epithele typhae]|uniref:phosphotyrosine protein phosphatase n=1 Tax=Epithele typhae TaxID=378194 RepID=UPI002007A679|nr:phosphotyrosine protein phosphatase [Epithele typhae]KAH9944028.1 phosphotyrosine protein phosphatase [Epithele typhae]
MSTSISVLVVCLGNICRSPLGEAVLKHVAKERGLDVTVDSAGTSRYHIGEDPDDRSVSVCKSHNVPIKHSARQVTQEDFRRFDYILAADEANLRDLTRVQPKDGKAELRLWGSYLDNRAIPDPYYGGLNGFEEVYKQCENLSNAFLDKIFGASTQSVE